VRAFALLGGSLRTSILEFKYNGLRRLAITLGDLMGQGWDALAPEGVRIEAIVPVPLHPARQRERGFNQAALLARELAGYLQCPVVEDVLMRSKPTTPQVGLDPAERRANVRGAFGCADGSLAGSCVLLVDDVYTTGSTLEAACTALFRSGVRSVWAYTLARAGSHSGGMSHINVKEAG
jgi:ComF family protein